MPDSFTKTIPIWCTVLNRLLFPEQSAYHSLKVNPKLTSKSEASQMSNRLDGFLKAASVCVSPRNGNTICLTYLGPETGRRWSQGSRVQAFVSLLDLARVFGQAIECFTGRQI